MDMTEEERYLKYINEQAKILEMEEERARQAQQREARERLERQQGKGPDNTILAMAEQIQKEQKKKESERQASENHNETMSAINGIKETLSSQIANNNLDASSQNQAPVNQGPERTIVKR